MSIFCVESNLYGKKVFLKIDVQIVPSNDLLTKIQKFYIKRGKKRWLRRERRMDLEGKSNCQRGGEKLTDGELYNHGELMYTIYLWDNGKGENKRRFNKQKEHNEQRQKEGKEERKKKEMQKERGRERD